MVYACLGGLLLLLVVVCVFAAPADPELLKAWMDEMDKS